MTAAVLLDCFVLPYRHMGKGDKGMKLPETVFSGFMKGGHVQGIAVDTERGFVYYSFTTALLKTDFKGKTVGTVTNLTGHLGCIVYDAERDLVYGSLEYKHDAIGRGIMNKTGKGIADEDAFYAVCFDCAKITRKNLDAETDGIMTAVYLPDVVDDYLSTDENDGKPHRYGCSGIDGTALGPAFGSADTSEKKIMIAYGIYGDTERSGNDHQVILQFGRDIFEKYGKPLNQLAPHHSGVKCEKKYFCYTGNTEYGIQNLEYDSFTDCYYAAVYKGKKPQFANFAMFAIDRGRAPVNEKLKDRNENGDVVFLAENQAVPKDYAYGAEGMASLGNGTWYFSVPGYSAVRNACTSTVRLTSFENKP